MSYLQLFILLRTQRFRCVAPLSTFKILAPTPTTTTYFDWLRLLWPTIISWQTLLICCCLPSVIILSVLYVLANAKLPSLHAEELYQLSPRVYYLRLQCIAKIDRFIELYTNVSRTMDSVFEAYLSADGVLLSVAGGGGEPDDIPKVNTTVWVLGKRYNAIQELELIRRDIQSRLWCTYRRGFVPLGEPQLTTDKGWGCMLRCGQMVLAQALIDLHLGRDWHWTPETRDTTYLRIVNRFVDSRKSYFSIHQIALMGDSEDKKVGQWFGPNTVAQVLKKLVRYDDWCSLLVHVAMDNTIITDDIYSLCLEDPSNDESWKPLLLIIPLRLGLSDINPIYIPALKRCFELVGSCGMIGGRPNQALYFLGYVDDEVLYLDPHTTQRSGTVGQKTSIDETEFDVTFHQKYAGRINFQQMDPSLAVCFLCKSRIGFDVIIDKLKTDVLTACSQPLFEITKKRSPEWISMPGTDTLLSTSLTSKITATTAATRTKTTPSNIGAKATNNCCKPSYESNISCCDSEDFERVSHVRTPGLAGNCCDGDADSDEDFEIIS